jgi:hypothetical protein
MLWGLFQKYFRLPVCRLGILVDRNYDRLDVVIAPAFMHPDFPDLGQAFKKGGLRRDRTI